MPPEIIDLFLIHIVIPLLLQYIFYLFQSQMIVLLYTVMGSLDQQNSMEDCSSVSLVTMENFIQGLAIWLPVFTLTSVKKLEEIQIFF